MVIIARDPDQLKIASGLIGKGTIAVAADLSSPAGIKAAVTEVAAQVDHVDAAFLNAGQAGISRLGRVATSAGLRGVAAGLTRRGPPSCRRPDERCGRPVVRSVRRRCPWTATGRW
ncbi:MULTISPECIES: hypothetical protein [Streptomyces]|uniref:hypothetical protein n=1 Tax=Streptomyces TaxID=1883 RepID=UPI000A641958|nr:MULTISPECIES: hypothetical protein [Streptomyces]MDI5907690.1 hypothetical protein [Streptomyces sp. 12257]